MSALESSVQRKRWRLGPLGLAVASTLAVTLFAFFERQIEGQLGLWPSGFVMAQITLLALWAGWAADAAWRRWALVAACFTLPVYLVLVNEWWQGGDLIGRLFAFESSTAFLMLVLVALLMPIRWLIGCRLTFSHESIAAIPAGRFGLAQLFGLTLVAALALGLLGALGARGVGLSQLIWPLIVLTLLVTSLLATLIPCVLVVFSRSRTALWLLLLAPYLCVAGIVATELFCHLNRVFRDPDVNMDYGEIRGWMYQVYAGFAMSFVLGLLILRLLGMQLIGGRIASNKRDAAPHSGSLTPGKRPGPSATV